MDLTPASLVVSKLKFWAAVCPKNMTLIREESDYLFKLVIIGDSAVGKTSLLLNFADFTFSSTCIPTIGVDFRKRIIDIDGKRVALQIWDTAGQELHRAISAAYYRGAHGVIIVFSLTEANSFDSAKRWLQDVNQVCGNIPQILVGNRCDDEENRVVLEVDALRLANQAQLQYFETSAKTSHNVEKIFYTIAGMMLKEKAADETADREKRIARIDDGIQKLSKEKIGKKKKCC